MKNTSILLSRVIATLFILLCHIIKFYSVIPHNAVIGQALTVGVPMFIIISAYLYGEKARHSKWTIERVKSFYFSRYLRVALPSQIWSLVILTITCTWSAVNILFILNLQGIGWIFDKFEGVISNEYISHTWFVTVILLNYLLLPVLSVVVNNRLRNILIVILVVITVLMNYVGVHLFYITLFVCVFYIARDWAFEKNRMWHSFLVMSISVVIRLMARKYCDGTILYNNIIVPFTQSLIAISIMMIINYLCCNHEKIQLIVKKSRCINYIDKHSYSIYLVHYCLIPIAFNASKSSMIVKTIIFLTGTVVISYILDSCTRFLANTIKKAIV